MALLKYIIFFLVVVLLLQMTNNWGKNIDIINYLQEYL